MSVASGRGRAGELRLVAELDVLADGQVGQQRLLLEHHADALAAASVALRSMTGLPRSWISPASG